MRIGANVQVAYYDQQREQLDPERTVADIVGEGNDTVTVNGEPRHIIGYLKDFLFPAERARSPVKALSGGERNRLLLARLFTRPANVLVLDEPTNDLDIETLELLEAQLAEWTGHAAARQPRPRVPGQRRHQHAGVRGRGTRAGVCRGVRGLVEAGSGSRVRQVRYRFVRFGSRVRRFVGFFRFVRFFGFFRCFGFVRCSGRAAAVLQRAARADASCRRASRRSRRSRRRCTRGCRRRSSTRRRPTRLRRRWRGSSRSATNCWPPTRGGTSWTRAR